MQNWERRKIVAISFMDESISDDMNFFDDLKFRIM